jgi:hypothetical protein
VRVVSSNTHRFRSRVDVEKFWRKVCNVPARTLRAKGDEERYALALFLRALSDHSLVRFPVGVIELKGESEPDFIVSEAGKVRVALEVTRATTPELQRRMTEAEREAERRGKPILMPLPSCVSVGDAAERAWLRLMVEAITRKLGKLGAYRRATGLERHDLLLYDDTPLLGVQRKIVLPQLARWIRAEKSRHQLLGRVAIVMSLDVVFDVAGDCRVLPFIDWNAPDRSRDLGERIAYAAQQAISKELHRTSSR